MSLTEKTLEVDSLSWFYREIQPDNGSDKTTTIFLHGVPSHSFGWCEVMTDLAKVGLSAIAPDWIGSGSSSQPDVRDFPYTPDAFVKALGNLIKAWEIKKCNLVTQGFLMGSMGLLYALNNPEAIERLVILNTPLTPSTKLPWKMKQWGLPFVGDVLTQDPLLVDRTLEGGSGYVIADKNLGVYRRPFLKSSDAGRALVATVRKLQKQSYLSEIESGLRQWSKPTLIIWGEEDPWLDTTAAEKLAKLNSHIELVKLEEAKHFPQEHFSSEISELMSNFLRRQISTEAVG